MKKQLTSGQKRRLETIRQRWFKFGYGLSQADYDIRFLLRLILDKDPNYGEK